METMTEKAYLLATQLARLRLLTKLIYEIHPDETVDREELYAMQRTINKWEMEAEKSIKVNSTP